jgi:hypothetical protein
MHSLIETSDIFAIVSLGIEDGTLKLNDFIAMENSTGNLHYFQ